jgi:hypothetical protein
MKHKKCFISSWFPVLSTSWPKFLLIMISD